MKEADHRFLFYLCETYKKLPDDPFFEEMEPLTKLWLYESWIHKIEQDIDIKKSIGIMIGGFSNPELANKMIKRENPDHMTTDDEFEESWKSVINEKQGKRRRRRRRKKKNKITGIENG